MNHTIFFTTRAAALAMAMFLGLLGGCSNSSYHRVGETMPASMNDRLALRIHEAQMAAYDAQRVLSGAREVTPQIAERADAAAWDYSRRVASVQDVIQRLPASDADADRVLAELQKAGEELDRAVAAIQSPERQQAWSQATAALSLAMASADGFLTARDSVYAGMLKDAE